MPDSLCATIVFENPGPAIDDKACQLPRGEGRHYKARRPHTKSRKGCSTCKIRHLKCDEHKPTCGQCTHGHRTCRYATPSVMSKSSSHGMLLPRHLPTDFLDGYYTGISETWTKIPMKTDPLELFDHFMHTNRRTWIGGPSCQSILQQHGPGLTVEAPYLRFAILSFAAYHLATLQPMTKKYDLASTIYYNCSLQSYSTALHNPGAADVDALFACSILLAMIAYKNLASLPQQREPSAFKEIVPDIAGLRAMAGFGILKRLPALQSQLGRSVMIGQCEGDELSHLSLAADYCEKLAILENLERFCNDYGGATTCNSAYDAALDSLRHLMLNEAEFRMIATYFSFTKAFDYQFTSSLEVQDPKALLLLCYWYAMGVRIGQWWMVESARLHGMRLLIFLRENPSADIQRLLDFPSATFETV